MSEDADQVPTSESKSTQATDVDQTSNADQQLPPSTPQQSVDQSSRASAKVELPDTIPSRWLDDIKRAISESRKKLIITTILSSSLLTGVVTTLANYFLEGRKTYLQLEFEDAKDTLHLYNDLRKEINDFKYELNVSASVFQVTAQHLENEELIEHVGEQIDSLNDRIATIKKSVSKLDDQVTDDLIQTTLMPLQEISAARYSRKEKGKLESWVKLCERSRDEGVKSILEQIDKRKQELSSRF